MNDITPYETTNNFDLLCPKFRQSPYRLYADLRREAPVYWSEQIQAWMVTRYDDVLACLQDHRISANRIIPRIHQFPEHLQEKFRPLERTLSMWPLMLDRPEHTRIRSLINKAITPSIVRGFIPTIQHLVDELLDKAQAKGGMDIIADLALPFPLNVVSEIIGVPAQHRDALKACAVNIVNFLGSPPHLYVEKAEIAMQSVQQTTELLSEILHQRRRQPGDDLISGLIKAEERGDVLNEEEILATCLMMVFAGFETTTNLIGNGLLLLLQHPAEERKLREDFSLLNSAISEMLRFESPVQRLSRMAKETFTLHGKKIRQGDMIFLIAASANRDGTVFPHPDRFDITRNAKNHLAFGHSIHLCPGNNLAQLETEILLRELLRRIPKIRLMDNQPDWQNNLSVRSLNHLHVTFS